MKLIEPDYRLECVAEGEWHFEESVAMAAATEKFDDILETNGGRRGLTVALRAFLNDHPGHIDALHHYAMCKMRESKPLDGFAFAHAAVASGRAALPPGFVLANNCLPGDWIENRPFLRALSGLMTAQRALGRVSAAIMTARELIGCDVQDRMGARLLLPIYLLEANRAQEALEAFRFPAHKDTFGPVAYLEALALIRLGRTEEIRAVLSPCFRHYPMVARHLLDPDLPRPKNESPYGVVVGSHYESWMSAVEQRWLWEDPGNALEALKAAWESHAKSHLK